MASTPDEATDAAPETEVAAPAAGTRRAAAAAADVPRTPGVADAPRPAPGGTAPREPARGRPGRRAPLALAASVTTAWAALVSLVPVLVVATLAQLVSGGSGQLGQVLRIGLAGWLLAHGVQLRTGIGPLGLAPLAFTVLAAWRVVRAGVHTTRAIGGRRRGSVRSAMVSAAGVGVVYGLLGAAAAALATMPGLGIPASLAGFTLGLFGFVAALAGALVESGVHRRLIRRTPMMVRDATRTGLVAALLILGAGAAAGGTALALSGGAASRVLAAYHTGVAGQAGLTLVCVVYGPNLAMWAASYLIGPGFALGTGTVVSAARVSLGTVPAVPVLAAVPTKPASGWAVLLLVVPLAAGMAAGWLLARRRLRGRSARAGAVTDRSVRTPAEAAGAGVGWGPLLAAAALTGPVAGLALAVAARASAGPLGGGHLADVGPDAWPLSGVAAGLVSAGAVVAAAATKTLIGVRRKGA
ncbi:DUF6350 family protein [Planosporangium sp. 12N6]|uniref:cell division protein PerM n=1 Tax=Planosporangium spinosum TaxID=3402278 RepID=UPI003CEC1B76